MLRDPVVAAALGVFALVVVACAVAPLYARHVSGTDPFRSDAGGTVLLNGKRAELVAENTAGLGLGTLPLGPTWRGSYLIGADGQGRDVAARLLYAGRASLLVASGGALLCLVLGALAGLAAGYAGGAVDAALGWLLDLLWAFPVYLLAISLSLVLIGEEVRVGPVTFSADSLALPALILGLVYVPYVARPVRAQVGLLRGQEWVTAAVSLGAGPGRVLFRHVLPGLLPLLLTMAPGVAAIVLLTEAALSFLGVGVQAPGASWGTMTADGQSLLLSRPLAALAPGAAVAVTVLALGVVSDAVRDRSGAHAARGGAG